MEHKHCAVFAWKLQLILVVDSSCASDLPQNRGSSVEHHVVEANNCKICSLFNNPSQTKTRSVKPLQPKPVESVVSGGSAKPRHCMHHFVLCSIPELPPQEQVVSKTNAHQLSAHLPQNKDVVVRGVLLAVMTHSPPPPPHKKGLATVRHRRLFPPTSSGVRRLIAALAFVRTLELKPSMNLTVCESIDQFPLIATWLNYNLIFCGCGYCSIAKMHLRDM